MSKTKDDAREFLKVKNIYSESLVSDMSAPENYTRLDELLVEFSKPEWIKCSDRLPPKDTPVLVFQPNIYKHLQTFVCAHDGSEWREFELNGIGDPAEIEYEDLTWYDEITHWQPLPNKPTE